MKAWLARLHTWVGVIVGIQLVLWLGSGLLMGLLDPEAVSGERTRAQVPEVSQAWPEQALAPEAMVARSASKVLLVERTWRLQRPVWRVQTQAGTWLADARTGTALDADARGHPARRTRGLQRVRPGVEPAPLGQGALGGARPRGTGVAGRLQ